MKMYWKGQWVDRPQTITIRDPQDGAVIDTVPQATPADMQEAITAGQQAFAHTRQLPTYERQRILFSAANYVAERQEDFAQLIAREGVKTIREARQEVTRCVETLRLSAEEARRLNGETIAFDQRPGSEQRLGYFSRMPIGLVGAITPFNDPLNLVAHKIGPAVAAGNPIIVKPHEATPLSALFLAQAFDQAGLPAGMVQVITGLGAEVGRELVRSPQVRLLSFTGGRPTGEAIIREAGLKKVGLELGSNSPVIVLNDADLELAVSATVSGAFWAAGQNCLHVQRLFVQEGIYQPFTGRFITQAEQYKVGDKLNEATDMGPQINEQAARRVEMLVNEALGHGAILLTGGERSGSFYAPTLLADVPDSCRLAHEEIFGPVTILYRFHTLEEAITQANSLDYGLQAGVFTQNVQTAFQAVQQLECGGVMVNDSTDYRIDAMPFGGIKGSGLGREGVRFALQEMTEPKVVCFNL